MWLKGLSDGEKYGLISQAASDAPLCLEGLEAVLQLGWYDMNVYIQTSTGIRHVLAGRPRALQPRQTQREQRVRSGGTRARIARGLLHVHWTLAQWSMKVKKALGVCQSHSLDSV